MPVIAISTTDEPDVIRECYKLGCSFYISKSVDHIEFVEVLGKLAQFISQPSVKLASMAIAAKIKTLITTFNRGSDSGNKAGHFGKHFILTVEIIFNQLDDF